MEKDINYYKDLIQKELNSKYPKWTLIIDYSKEARKIQYPTDISHLFELSGLGEIQDYDKEYKSPKIENDDEFWNI